MDGAIAPTYRHVILVGDDFYVLFEPKAARFLKTVLPYNFFLGYEQLSIVNLHWQSLPRHRRWLRSNAVFHRVFGFLSSAHVFNPNMYKRCICISECV